MSSVWPDVAGKSGQGILPAKFVSLAPLEKLSNLFGTLVCVCCVCVNECGVLNTNEYSIAEGSIRAIVSSTSPNGVFAGIDNGTIVWVIVYYIILGALHTT